MPEPVSVPHPAKLLAIAAAAAGLVMFVLISMVNAGGLLEFLAWATLAVLFFCDCFSRMALSVIERVHASLPQRPKVGWDEPALREALHNDRMRTLQRGHDWDVADVMAVLIEQGKPK